MTNSAIVTDFARWCRANGYPRPAEESVLRQLFSVYMQEQLHSMEEQDVLGEFLGAQEQHDDDDTVVETNERNTILHNHGPRTEIEDRYEEDDDFHQLIRDRNHAMHAAGGDDLVRDVVLQKNVHGELHAEAPFTRSNPASLLNGVIGSNIIVQPGADPVMVANWVGKSDVETGPVTCIFSSVGNTWPSNSAIRVGTSSLGNRLYGRVQFGTRGFLSTVDVDIGVGTQFSVFGSQVTLQIGLDNTTNAKPINVSGMLSFKSTHKTVSVTRTRYIDSLLTGGANGQTVTVPQYAKSMTVWRNDPVQPIVLQLINSLDQEMNPIVFAGNEISRRIDLQGDIYKVTVYNYGTSKILLVKLLFELFF